MTETLLIAAVVAAVISVSGVVFSTLVPLRADVAARKRERYAEAIGALVEWFELPYRVARRVDDEGATIGDLVDRTHDLQVAIVKHQAWIAGESRTTYRAYDRIAAWTKDQCRGALREAWSHPANPEQTNVGDLQLDQGGLRDRVADLNDLIGLRFGWGRVRLVKRFRAWTVYR